MKFKALLALVFLCNYLNGQLTDINDSDWFRSGNFLVKELTSTVNNDIKGTPYLNKTFENGQIIFSNGNSYLAMMRLNIGNQKFEILNTENNFSKSTFYLYKIFKIESEELIQLDDYFLEYFVRLLKRLRDINFEDVQKQKNLII